MALRSKNLISTSVGRGGVYDGSGELYHGSKFCSCIILDKIFKPFHVMYITDNFYLTKLV